jgi:hypothetical protein
MLRNKEGSFFFFTVASLPDHLPPGGTDAVFHHDIIYIIASEKTPGFSYGDEWSSPKKVDTKKKHPRLRNILTPEFNRRQFI